MRFALLVMVLAAINAGCNKSRSNAPPDRPVDANGKSEVEDYRAAVAPYVEKAQKTYPEAKKRYLAGLPQGNNFFAVTNLRDRCCYTPVRAVWQHRASSVSIRQYSSVNHQSFNRSTGPGESCVM